MEYVNIVLCKEFGRSESQLLETSVKFRNDCRLYILEKNNQEYIRQQEEQIKNKRNEIFNDLNNK